MRTEKRRRKNNGMIRASKQTVHRIKLFQRLTGLESLDEVIYQMCECPTLQAYLCDRNIEQAFNLEPKVAQKLLIKQRKEDETERKRFELGKNVSLVKVDE